MNAAVSTPPNIALSQMLGLCPLLAVSNSVVNALGLALATVAVMTTSNALVSLTAKHVRPEIRIVVFVVIIASAVTCVELLARAYAHSLYLSLGIFLPLIVTNCAILARAEAFASKNGVFSAIRDGWWCGLGFGVVLVALGALREVIGKGTLLSDMDRLLGPFGDDLTITISEHGFLLAIMPAGGFMLFGAMVAWHQHRQKRKPAAEPEAVH